MPVNKQLSDKSKTRASKITSSSCSISCYTEQPSAPCPPPTSVHTHPLLPTLPRLCSFCRGLRALCLCSKGFLTGNFLWWKLWGNFLLVRPLQGADNMNHLKPPSLSCWRGWGGPSLLSQSLRGQERASVWRPQESHSGGIFQKLKATAVISQFFNSWLNDLLRFLMNVVSAGTQCLQVP